MMESGRSRYGARCRHRELPAGLQVTNESIRHFYTKVPGRVENALNDQAAPLPAGIALEANAVPSDAECSRNRPLAWFILEENA